MKAPLWPSKVVARKSLATECPETFIVEKSRNTNNICIALRERVPSYSSIARLGRSYIAVRSHSLQTNTLSEATLRDCLPMD